MEVPYFFLASNKRLSGSLYCLFSAVFPFKCWRARTVKTMSISVSVSPPATDTAGCSNLWQREEIVAKLGLLHFSS